MPVIKFEKSAPIMIFFQSGVSSKTVGNFFLCQSSLQDGFVVQMKGECNSLIFTYS